MKKHYVMTKLIATLAACSLAIAPVVHHSQPTSSEFTREDTVHATINMKPFIVSPWVYPNILDGNCADIKVDSVSNSKGYKKITFQYSRSANMANPLSITITVQNLDQETKVTLTRLAGNATYYYRTRVEDAYRVEWSSVNSFTTTSAIAVGQYFNCDDI